MTGIQRVLCSSDSMLLFGGQRHFRHNPSRLVRQFSTEFNHKSDDYQYLQRGQIPMLHFQRSLPRLKVPDLQKTCDRFLAAVQPLSTHPAAYDNLVDCVTQFRTTGTGPLLQKYLLDYDRANKHTSYVSKPWFEMYLQDRKALPINYNPALVMKLDSRPEYNDQLTRASNLIVTSLRFMRSLREEVLEPEVYHMNPKKSDTERYRKILSRTPGMVATLVSWAFKAFPLDMSQVPSLHTQILTSEHILTSFLNDFSVFICSIKVCLVLLAFQNMDKMRLNALKSHHTFVSYGMDTFMLSMYWIMMVWILNHSANFQFFLSKF